MPPKYFLKHKLLRTLAGFLLNNGQNSQFLNSGNCISKPISTLSGSVHPIRTIDLKAALEVVIGLGESTQKASGKVLQRNMMSCSGSSLMGSTELGVRQSESLNWRSARMLKPNTSGVELSFGGKCLEYCKRASGTLKSRDTRGGNMAYRCLSCNTVGPKSKAGLYMDMWARDFHTSCSSSYSAWTASDVSLDGVPREEVGSSSVTTDQKLPCDGTLKLLSGSCYLPHPDKEETGGEDAHFICTDGRAIGVADGVGGWADFGVDAGKYARELMSNAVSAIQEEPNGSIDPARVLEKAYTSTTAKGSSTACIIALTNKGLRAVNLGDSGFIVVRDGCTVFRSPVQQHDFNFPYQLESGNGSDLPSSAQVFTVSVAPGDVVVAGTDGLFDNLYNNEVTAVIVHAVRAGFEPQVTAQKIAALARQRALDKNRQTPFSTAAQDAGCRYYGGKLDDITVVVSYVKALTA